MVVRAASVVLVVLGLVACSKPVPAPVAPVAKREVRVPTVVAAPRQTPSQAVLSRWNAPASPDVTGYGDLGALFQTELFRELVPGLIVLTEAELQPQAGDCIQQWAGAVREVVFAANQQGGLAVISYNEGALKTPVRTCIETLFALKPIEVANAKFAYAIDESVLAVGPGVLLVGDRTMVERGLASKGPGEWPNTLALAKDQQLAFAGSITEDRLPVEGYLSVSNEHFVVHTEVTFPSIESANVAAASMASIRLQQDLPGRTPQMIAISELIGQNLFVEQTGRKVAFEVRLVGDPKVLAARLGVGAAKVIYWVRKYIDEAKVAEARTVTRKIARHLIEAKLNKLTSFPAVPAKFDAVKGKKYQSAPADWSQWQTIQFSIEEPQYFQYHVEAAKGGKAATVIAEGDLDGNGRRLRLSLGIELDPKTNTLRVADELSEEDSQGLVGN